MVRRKKGTGGRKISPLRPKELIAVFLKVGYEISGQSGSHVIMRHPSRALTLAIPVHGGMNVHPEIIQKLLKKAGLSGEDYFDLL